MPAPEACNTAPQARSAESDAGTPQQPAANVVFKLLLTWLRILIIVATQVGLSCDALSEL